MSSRIRQAAAASPAEPAGLPSWLAAIRDSCGRPYMENLDSEKWFTESTCYMSYVGVCPSVGNA